VNYWYAARPNEVFLDLDSRKALMRAMKILRKSEGVKAIYHYPTSRAGHCHVIVVLAGVMSAKDRALDALWMGSDKLRACYVFSRIEFGFSAVADLLVTKRPNYHRKPDSSCSCEGKHKAKEVTDNCPALQELLGPYRSHDFFPLAGHERMSMIRVPVGRVPLKLIRTWRVEE